MRPRYLPLLILLTSCPGDNPGPVLVASVDVSAAAGSSLTAGATLQLSAVARDAGGSPLTGRTITWASNTTSIATVAGSGLVTGVAPGTVTITATSEGVDGDTTLTVLPATFDVSISDAQFTQAVQAADASIPVLLGGNGAVLNVLLTTTSPVTQAMQLVLRLLDSTSGALVRSDTVLVPGVAGASTYANPHAQIFVPAAALRAGLRWEVLRDPRGVAPDVNAGNDRFPLAGPARLATFMPETLKVRLVPVVLTSHGNATGTVTAGDIAQYLPTLRSVMPIGPLTVVVGTSLLTSASFGTAPSGGQSGFWLQVLSELDAARLNDPPNADQHWVAVVRPPNGFNFTSFGGFSYIPTNYADAGPSTKSSALVVAGWFNRAEQTRELMAHELGHSFGRRHAPCGSPSSPDPSYPIAGGTTGIVGHDVYARSQGLAGTAVAQPASSGDIMSYCVPPWISLYTYNGVLNFRGAAGPAPPAQATAAATVLMVRGTISGAAVTLAPALTLQGRPALPARGGAYTLEGIAGDGTRLFAYPFDPAEVDHSDARPFLINVPLPESVERALAVIRVRGPGAPATIARLPARATGAAGADARPALAQGAGGTTRVSCPDPSARAIAVQDERTGRLLGMAPGAVAVVQLEPGAAAVVSCSDGVGSSRARVVP